MGNQQRPMDKNSHIEECRDETVPHLPMGQLFYLLHGNGFNVKPDDYIEMLKITERFGSADIDKTAQWLCPIIATTQTEQSRFYNIIEQYKKMELLAACGEPVIQKRWPGWIMPLAFSLLLILLLSIFYFLHQKKSWQPEEFNKERTVEKGQPLLLSAASLLTGRLQDTAYIRFNWHFNDGSSQQGVQVTHVFKDAGDCWVKRDFSSGRIHLLTKSDSLLIHVCNDLPVVNIRMPAEGAQVKQPVTLTATVDASPGTVSGYQWTINDSVFTTLIPVAQGLVFYREGDYPVECKAIVGNAQSPCSAADNAILRVSGNALHYAANFSAPAPVLYSGKTILSWWVSLAFLLPAAGGLFYSFIKRKKKEEARHQKKPVSATVAKGPYDIPFEQTDTRLVQPERDLRATFTQMKYKAEEETTVLSIHGTIRSIIRSGGSPQLVFTALKEQQQYLLLIDHANPKSMLTHFFSYLAKSIQEEGIPTAIFYYDKNFTCYNSQHPAGLSLQRLADGWGNATLILLGKAHELVYSVYPVMEEKLLTELNRWQNKAVITPVALQDWSVKEKVLQENLILLPADVTALQRLIPALKEKIKLSKNLLVQTVADQYAVREVDFRDIPALQAYLNSDELLFQWLCAICIYPRLSWEVMIEIGKALFDKYGRPESLNYSTLLLLCRISWMQQGVFPQTTRLELLKQLKIENEILARQVLLHMLNYSTLLYGKGGHFFEEEKNRQVLTNQFILHASNNDANGQYADSKEAFKKIWRQDAILDMPVKKYLDKKSTDTWETPVSDGNNSVGLAAYFNLHEIALNKKPRRNKIMAAAVSILLLISWLYIDFGGGAEKLFPPVALSQQQHPATVQLALKVIRNFQYCGDSVKNSFEQLTGYLQIKNKKIPLLYNLKTATALFEVPYENFRTGKGLLLLNWELNKSVATTMNFAGNRWPDSVTLACINTDKISRQYLYVRYNDTAGYHDIEHTLTDALYKFSLSALPDDFSDSSRIIYYETNQKNRADSIVNIVKQALNITVREEYIHEERTPPATPILFLNTKVSNTDTNNNDDPDSGNNADASDHQHLGDMYVMKNQYQKALKEYTETIKLNPKNALAHYQRGLCYEMLGDAHQENAITDYSAAIRLNGNDALFYYRRASVWYGLKKYAEAIPDFDKVIKMNTDNSNNQASYSLYFRGKSKLFLNNQAGACDDFKKASEAGVAAGKKDYATYCGVPAVPVTTVPAATVPDNRNPSKNPASVDPGTANGGYIEPDAKGFPNSAGLQTIERLAAFLKTRPAEKIRLTATYATEAELKTTQNYVNNIIALFIKDGVDDKTSIVQQLTRIPSTAAPASNRGTVTATVIDPAAINKQSKY